MLNKLRKKNNYQKINLDLQLTKKALENTAKSRNSYNTVFEKIGDDYLWKSTLDLLKNDNRMHTKWKNYSSQKLYAQDIEFDDTLLAISEMMDDILA